MQIEGKLESNLWSQNVIGTLAGSALPNEEVVVCAHYDCAANSVGADDNASGVETMLRVATRLVNGETQKTVKFIGFGAEEPSMLGSRYCVNDLKERGVLSRVKAAINLDMIGAGKMPTIASEPGDFHQLVSKTILNSKLRNKVEIDTTSMRISEASDHWEFHANHIPVTMLVCWPYEHLHKPTDTVENLNEELIDETAEATYMLIKNLRY